MSNNIENERTITSGKMYPIDLAPQKITIVKSMPNTDVKMAHLLPGQPKTTNTNQIISHGAMGPIGVMRATQIISPGVTSQPQIVSGSPIIQGTQIVSQGSSQILGQNSQIINQSQILSSGQLLTPGTQIISQGTQLSAQVTTNNVVQNNSQASNGSSSTLLNVGGGLVSSGGNLVVNSSVRSIPPSVRVLPPMTHHNTRPVLSNVNSNSPSGVLVTKGATSHVPRGLAAGASLAVRPVVNAVSSTAQGGGWSNRSARGALVYGSRARSPAPRPPAPVTIAPHLTPTQSPHSTIVTLANTTVLTSSSVISSTVRAGGPPPAAARSLPPAPPTQPSRPLPLLQRNYQPSKLVGVANVGLRGVVGNSAPPQLYYEVPRGPPPQHQQQAQPQQQQIQQPLQQIQQPHQQLQQPLQQLQPVPLPRLLAPYSHAHNPPVTPVNVVNAVQSAVEVQRQPPSTVQNSTLPPRPTILRKRDIDGSPSKIQSMGIANSGNISAGQAFSTGWEDVPTGGRPVGVGSGSTTISAASSPTHDLEPEPPRHPDLSPRKKPRKQILIISNEVRQCEFPPEDTPPTPPPPAPAPPPPKRPTLRSSFVCGWRGTALHFTRPAEVRRREARSRDLAAIASQRHVLSSADGWKVHHLTAQMDDLVSLEADVGEQLTVVLRSLENSSGRGHTTLQPLSHTLLELIKGNIQRSKIVCEGIQEAREDILRVFKHRNFVSDILTRQSEKRCFRKHRSMS